jgi:nicotinamidase-related amidase
VINTAREGNCPVFYTTVQYTSHTLSDAGLFYLKSRALEVWKEGDTRGYGDWMPGLVPDKTKGDSVIVKKYPSGFFGTTLATELNVRNVDTVVLCGVSTSGCVRASALDAMCYGFRPMVSFANPRKWKMIWANEGKIGRCRSMRRSHG